MALSLSPDGAAPAARRLLFFLVSLGLVWGALQFLVWPLVQPHYARAVTAAADAALGAIEAGSRVTRLRAEGPTVRVLSGIGKADSPMALYSAEVLHFYVAIVASLILVFPGAGPGLRLRRLAAALACLFVFHVAVLLIVVETLYAAQLTPFSGIHYTGTERTTWLILRATTLYFAMQFVPAGVLAWLFVSARGSRGETASPGAARPKLPRWWAAAAAGVALAAAVPFGWHHLGRVRLRQAEQEGVLGYRALESGAFAEAETRFTAALARNPRLGQAHDGLGLTRMRQQRLEEAEASFREAIELLPREPLPHLHLGNALAAKGDVEAALAEYRATVALEPARAGIWMNLAMTARRLGRDREAEPALRKALDLEPGHPAALNEIAALLVEGGRECEAIPFVEKLEAAGRGAGRSAELKARCGGGEGASIRPRP